jgi:hypothetical protein
MAALFCPFHPLQLVRVMTGYTVHTGSSEKFSGGWDKIFGTKKTTAAPAGKKATAKAAKKKSAGSSKKAKGKKR